MDKQQARNLIRQTFEQPFDKVRFILFIKNLLNRIEDASFTYQGQFIPDAYKPYIGTLERIGKYNTGEQKIDILAIKLNKETSLERARTRQRNFVAWYLNGSRGGEMKDAALVAFVSPDNADWRFSLVKMDYKFKQTKSGSVKVEEEFTPARRWSFLVGVNEKSHTAQSRLIPLLANDDHDPGLAELEEAFNIETVTKEFFFKYRGLFLRTKEELDRLIKKDSKIADDFVAKGVDTVNFAKKLLGQIVFLYFLQKKGWFGVGRDNDWGTGSKHFLRELFDKRHGGYENFFNDVLEHLFYDALRNDRVHNDYYCGQFNCKIPFLNGGLFDPIGNYDWVHTDIQLPDNLFSNKNTTREGDEGDGILDIFDRYNFTVKEDEPLEKDVAIDPELLGKTYEKFNAIRPDNFEEYKRTLNNGKTGEESKFNKKFGVYYTPREIVHYMCQQSLINYLKVELAEKVPEKDIETLIQIGEHVSENDATALLKEKLIEDGKQKTTINKLILPESIRQNAVFLDQKLADITVCDPAVGSGAFPVGMMNEIVRTRTVLSTFIEDKKLRTPYTFKRQCIEHSLYGVDIDPGAVEIAKLRLWLSLVVDEDDINNIKPLPNLDYRIMQGNSLISEFMGVNFDINKDKKDANSMFKDKTDDLVLCFQQKKSEFLKESNVTKKSIIKEEVDGLLVKIFETKLKTQKADYFNRLKTIENKYSILPNQKQRDQLIKQEKEKLYKDSGFNIESVEKQLKDFTSGKRIKPFFLWDIYFSEVFHDKGGFDAVIANPPYMKERDNKSVFEIINNSNFGEKYHQGKMDYWYYFLHKAIDICKNQGTIAYITSRYWLNSSGAKNLIKRVKKELSFTHFVDIGKLKIFDEVAGHHMIALYQKAHSKDPFRYKKLENDLSDLFRNQNTENIKINTLSNKTVFSESDEIIIEKFEFDQSNIVLLGKITDTSIGVQESPDKISKKMLLLSKRNDVKAGQGVFVLEENEILNLGLNKDEMAILKKYLDPNDVQKYRINYKNKYLIYSNSQIKEKIKRDKNYKNIKNHLDKFKGLITSSNKPYGLHRPREEKYFLSPKIIFKNMFVSVDFGYDESDKYYFGFSFSSIIQKDYDYNLKYILAILNSKFAENWFYKNGKKRGAGLDIGVEKLRLFPIKKISEPEQKSFINLVNHIFSLTDTSTYSQNYQRQTKVREYEAQIDKMVNDLYGLAPN